MGCLVIENSHFYQSQMSVFLPVLSCEENRFSFQNNVFLFRTKAGLILSQGYLCSWKMLCKSKSCKSNTKFPFKTMCSLRVRGLKTPSYIVHDYSTSRYINLYSMYVLDVQYIYISIQYTNISIQYIYLFLVQWNVRDSHS